MKRTLCILLIIAIVMNFIVCSISYAEEDGGGGTLTDTFLNGENENTSATPSNTAATSILEDGQTSQKNGQSASVSTNSTMAGMSIIGVIMGYIALMIDIVPLQIQIILSMMTVTESTEGFVSDLFLTIEKIVFNKVALFNTNYFDSNNEYTVGNKDEYKITITAAEPNLKLKKSITEMYMICRIIALAIGLLVLIYIGMRMAFSTVATEEARYKKMLVSWCESIVLIFCMVYIMVLIINFGEMLVSIFYDMRCQLLESGENSFETVMFNEMLDGIINGSGLKLAMYSLMYWALVFSQFKFFYLYMKRLLSVGFLIMISPLITITYSIDKAGDGRAQAFQMWFKEFTINALIQPLHALIYLIFMFTAGEIAKYAPVVGLAFMLSLGSAERMVKVIFDMGKMTSLRGVDKFMKKG